jgi:hypothetical protein
VEKKKVSMPLKKTKTLKKAKGLEGVKPLSVKLLK